jgi:DTW domain-containing protein YfiP
VPRAYCELCHYPKRACLCAHVQPMVCDTQVIVMQHPDEVSQSKNTVHLLGLVLPQLQVYIGEAPTDFIALKALISASAETSYLIYPSDNSISLDALVQGLAQTGDLISSQADEQAQITDNQGRQGTIEQVAPRPKLNIILLDGTWRKAYKILQLNPWLLDLPSLHLSFEGKSQYTIRKSSRPDSLSTLEAAAYSLQALEPELDITPILKVFNAMVQQRLDAMPKAVRQRYTSPESPELTLNRVDVTRADVNADVC